MRRRGSALALAIVVTCVVALTGTTARAQSFGSAAAFTIDFEPGRQGGVPVLTGHVRNDNVWKVTKVRLGIDILDAGGNRIGATSTWVFGDIAPEARTYFVARLPSEGARYRVYVESFDFLLRGGM